MTKTLKMIQRGSGGAQKRIDLVEEEELFF
jgi:hypothetical protein